MTIAHSLFLLFVVITSSVRGDYGEYDCDYGDATCPPVSTCYSSLLINGRSVGSDGNSKDTFNPGERMRIVCSSDYVITGEAETTCMDNFTWSWSAEPRCTPKPTPAPLCTDPAELVEGMYVIKTEMLPGGAIYKRQEIACYDDQDYRLVGSGVYSCEGTQWKGNNVCLRIQVCPRVHAPRHGLITIGNVESRGVGNEIHFGCNDGYILKGHRKWKCRRSLMWSGGDVYCEKDLGILGMATRIREDIIDKYTAQTVNVSNRGRLSSSNVNGIDLIFLVDRSDSISPNDLKMGLAFISILVDFFGILSKGGATRLTVISFGTTAKIELGFNQIGKLEDCIIKAKQAGENIQDLYSIWARKCLNITAAQVDGRIKDCVQMIRDDTPAELNKTEISLALKDMVKKKLNLVQSSGGGTNIGDALSRISEIPMRCNAEKAVFLMSDGRDNITDNLLLDAKLWFLRRKVDEVFAIGIGQDLNMDQLRRIASLPTSRYLFRLKDYRALQELQRLIINKPNSYDDCGVSAVQRSKEVNLNESVVQQAKQRSWPWLVKVAVSQGPFECGGALVAKNYVLTAASCLYDENGVLLVPANGDNPIEVTAGYYSEDTGAGVQSSEADSLIVHKDFDIANPIANNIALIKTNTDIKLNPFVRTICLPGPGEANILLQKGRSRWMVGWNTSTSDPLTTMTLEPFERTMDLYLKTECSRQHPDTRSISYLQCMGDRHQKKGHCSGDVGAPIMVPSVDEDGKPIYKVAALVLNGTQCMQPGKSTVVTQIAPFMTWIHDNIKLD